jgi:hypothetical protein
MILRARGGGVPTSPLVLSGRSYQPGAEPLLGAVATLALCSFKIAGDAKAFGDHINSGGFALHCCSNAGVTDGFRMPRFRELSDRLGKH